MNPREVRLPAFDEEGNIVASNRLEAQIAVARGLIRLPIVASEKPIERAKAKSKQ